MNVAPSSMSTMLASRAKDLLCAVEFYSPTYTPHVSRGFEPNNALALYATETASYVFTAGVTVNYFREALSMPSLQRSLGKQSNSVTIRFSNVSRRLATFVLNNEVEGMRVVIRLISRANLADALGPLSWVMFVGRCAKADGFDRKDASITARQDLGQIEAQIPPQVFTKDCPLRFKGTECLGTEALGAKSAAYQAGVICKKTFGACTTYSNTKFFQGIRIEQIQGSFRYRPHQGFFSKLLKFTAPVPYWLFLRRKNRDVGSSTFDGTPYGKAIPIVLGRQHMPGIPLQYKDDGQTIHFLEAFCRGPIENFYNIRVDNPEFINPPVTVVGHYGRYGGEANQAADTVFPEGGFFSRLAYITGGVTGSDILVEDPAPEISAMIAGISAAKVTILSDSNAGEGTTDTAGVYSLISAAWTDNPVDLALFVLTDPGLLNIGQSWYDSARTAKTSIYANGAIQDDTNAERLVLPDTETGSAGVNYHRYYTTGVIICSGSSGSANNGPMFAGAATEVTYEYYNPAAPPTSFAVVRKFRKRYSCNIALTEQRKALDFLYDTILPTFRGFLSWDTFGRVGVRCERPADSTLVRGASIVGATTIKVNDVLPWILQFHENNTPLIGKLLIGVGLTTSEVRTVTLAQYTADGNSITLAASASGSIVATASGGTLTGGSTSVAASGTIVISGTFAAGDTVTATINGVAVVYTLEGSGFNKFKTANCLAFAINANRTLNKYIVAHCPALDDTVHISSKQGVLTVAALANAHSVDEETIRVMMSFAGKAITAANTTIANVLDGTFKYLGNDGQTRYNQFKGTFHDPLRDFAEHPVVVNDYTHQDDTGIIKPLDIDLSAVDNYNQASRLLNGAAAKFGDGVDFFSWQSNGMALQIEEGDVVCVSDDSGSFINVPVRIESLSIDSEYRISLKGRIYSTTMFDDFVEETSVPLPSGLKYAQAPPAILFNTAAFPPAGLIQTIAPPVAGGMTSIRGGAIFGASSYPQYAKVRILRPGSSTYEQPTIIYPDSNNEAIFEFLASVDGVYTVELEVCNQWGCNTTKPTATIIIGYGSLYGLAREDGSLLLREQGDVLEREY